MPRLHLKRTPAEEEQHARKKAKKSSRKRKEAGRRDSRDVDGDWDVPLKKRHHRSHSRSKSPKREPGHHSRRYYNQVPSPEDAGPSSYDRHKEYCDHLDDETARARMQEELFEEKMRDALEEDGLYDATQRLDGVEARLNSYAHIPRRWRGTDEGFSAGLWMEDAREDIGLEPWQMNDDEYAEYMRAGMWRKKNQAEYEERLRRKEERKMRAEREAQLRAETRKLEQEAQADRQRRAADKARRRLTRARELYEQRWAALTSRSADKASAEECLQLSFGDIPWPIAPSGKDSSIPNADDLTKDAVSSFLIPSAEVDKDTPAPPTKDILRASMLRFHPDKFEARVLVRVNEKDRELVKDAANKVVRILNELLKELRE